MKKDRTRICKEHPNTERIIIENFGTRCKICYEKSFEERRQKNIERAIKIHSGEYDYHLVHHGKVTEKIKIICHIHGIFEQHIYNHLKGEKCPNCRIVEKTALAQDVIKKFIQVHGHKYNYSLVKYINSKTEIDIICNKHGIFSQKPEKHTNGQGCPNCRFSHGESQIQRILEKNNIIYESQKKFISCINESTGKNLKFDFFLLQYNVCIEYDGEQHFEPRFSKKDKSIIDFKKIKESDYTKNEFCKNNKILLLRIPYYEKKNIEQILEKNILKWQIKKELL